MIFTWDDFNKQMTNCHDLTIPEGDDPDHFPWHYTEYGVVCVCGDAMDADENCLSRTRPA